MLKSVLEAGIVPDKKLGKVRCGNGKRAWMQMRSNENGWLDIFPIHQSSFFPAYSDSVAPELFLFLAT